MDIKEKIVREKELLGNWDEIAGRQKDLIRLLLTKGRYEEIDIIIFYQCLNIVTEKDFTLLLQCVSAVALELNIKKIETKILEKLYSE